MAPTNGSALPYKRPEDSLDDISASFLDSWIYLNLISNQILLPILVLTFLISKHAKRHPIVLNVCLTWIAAGFFFLLLFYAGQHKGPEPPKLLCMVQTSLLYGVPPMWSVAVLMMTYYIKATLEAGSEVKISTPKLIFMLSSPYIAETAFAVAAFIVSMKNPNRVDRSRRVLYCSLRSERIFMAMAMFTLLLCLATLIVKTQNLMTLRKNAKAARDAGRPSSAKNSLIARVVLFGIFVLGGMATNFVSMVAPKTNVQDIFAAIGGIIIFFIFGAQSDVMRVWCFWRKETPAKAVRPDTPVDERMQKDIVDLSDTLTSPLPYALALERSRSQSSWSQTLHDK